MAGGAAPAIYNAANEECVSAFMAGRIPFTGIVDTVAPGRSEQGGTGRDIGELPTCSRPIGGPGTGPAS